MKGIINAFSTIINMFKMVWNILMGFFETLAMVFNILVSVVNVVINTIASLPAFIKAFALITICISLAYFLIGRDTGKSGS